MVGSHGLWHQEKEAVMLLCNDCQQKNTSDKNLCGECRQAMSDERRWQYGSSIQQKLDAQDQQEQLGGFDCDGDSQA